LVAELHPKKEGNYPGISNGVFGRKVKAGREGLRQEN